MALFKSKLSADRLFDAAKASLCAAVEVAARDASSWPYPADLMGSSRQPECLDSFSGAEIQEACAFLVRLGILERPAARVAALSAGSGRDGACPGRSRVLSEGRLPTDTVAGLARYRVVTMPSTPEPYLRHRYMRDPVSSARPRSKAVGQPRGDEVHILPRTALLDEVAGEEVGVGTAQRGVPAQVPVNADARLVPDVARPAPGGSAQHVATRVVQPVGRASVGD